MADDLAQCYLMSYPPDVAASDLDEAREEMNATFRGDYGKPVSYTHLRAHET